MAASLTLSAASLAADGKTLTATISGGTGTGNAISSPAGIAVHLVGGNAYVLPHASASVSGSTLTVLMALPFDSAEVVQLDISASTTLTDSGGNTPTGQANVAVVNNSTVAVTTVLVNSARSSFEISGLFDAAPADNGIRPLSAWLGTLVDSAYVEFVAHATDIGILTYVGTATNVRVDGATSDTTILNPEGGGWNVKPALVGGAVGKHLVLTTTDYFIGVRLSGGNRTMHTVPITKRTMQANTATDPVIPSATEVTTTGAWKPLNAGRGDVASNAYLGVKVEFGFTGSGVEIATVADNGGAWATSIDGAAAGAMVPAGDSAMSGTLQWVRLASGLPSASHSIEATCVSLGINAGHSGVRVINGTALTTASIVGATTLVVASVATLAVGDWVKIDYYSKREWRQITGITGTTLTLNAALAQAHAIGAAVTSYSAPAATITTHVRKDVSVKRLVAMGDSNTLGGNEYGLGGGGVTAGTPDASGTYYSSYDPRQSPLYLAGQTQSIEVVNLGVQGEGSANMAARAADIATYGRGAYDYVAIWAGTNDINGGGTTPAQYKTNVQTIISAAIPSLRPNGRVLLMAPGTPSTTSGAGLDIAACQTQLQQLAVENLSTIYVADALVGVVSGDLMFLHYLTSGRQKIAANLRAYIGGAGGFFLGDTKVSLRLGDLAV